MVGIRHARVIRGDHEVWREGGGGKGIRVCVCVYIYIYIDIYLCICIVGMKNCSVAHSGRFAGKNDIRRCRSQWTPGTDAIFADRS